MSNFVVQFPLVAEKWQADILNKRFEIGRKIYNSLVSKTLKRYKEMIKTNRYKNLVNSLERDSNGKQIHLKKYDTFNLLIGTGDVGIDIGTSTIAYCTEDELKILELADKVRDTSKEKRRLLRAIDRSKRATNPNNFNDEGSVKTGVKTWIFSNKYTKLKNRLKDIFRKEADIRKYQHECLANHIISLGDKIYVEQISFSGLQRRSKTTEKNEKGKFKRKKRFGKSLGRRAPAMLLEIIDRKLSYFGKKLLR